MQDTYGRTIDYMRISITDLCNLRCRYCMPEGVEKRPMSELLTFEQIVEISEAAAAIGIRRFKITGGEPLVRRGAPQLIRMIHDIPGAEQVTLTTNGVLLSQYLPELRDAGLQAVNISLDTLDPAVYEQITGRDELERVLRAVQDSLDAGLKVKINAVLQKDRNADAWVRGSEILEKIRALYPDLEEDHSVHGNGPAVYVHIPEWQGSIGFISAVHGKFCGSCNRIRLTSTGKIKPCLCYGDPVDLMPVLRDEALSESGRHQQLIQALRQAIEGKPEAHHFERKQDITELHRMVEIGG